MTARLLTTEQVAEMLGISADTMFRWRQARRGPKFVRSRNFIRYDMREVEAWLAAGGDDNKKDKEQE
jgi:excisionase family DNA binding protein